jgi:exopolysaccharide biosynthesis polyprenyl glycosylphosphotransferase
MSKKLQLAKYLISDYLAALLSWTCFYIFRKAYIEPLKFGYKIPISTDERFYLGLLLIPVFWLILYYSSGYYRDVYRKSRLSELWYTILICLFGVIVLFFALILDDTIQSYSNYYLSFLALFSFHFTLTYIPRLVITTHTAHKIHNRIIGFNTIIIGSNRQAVDIYLEIQNQERSSGNKIIGFVNVNDKSKYLLQNHIPHLGSLDELKQVIRRHKVEEVIIAIDPSEHDKIGRIINSLIDSNVIIKAIPSMYDILTGKVRMNTIFGTPLILVSHQLMPVWQENLKHFFDIVISMLALIVFSPLCIFLILGIKLTSKGPVFYSHERIGRYGKPFKILKFRSMYVGSEKNGPELSSKNDDRVTRFGRFMRKHRLDEIPNFYNVIKGEMSLVGPRPERKYFLDRITEKAPHYIHLLKVRPGITSWGQVKFGYAENVEQMIKRLKYDLIYIDNMSLYVDIKIIIYTLITIFKGRGI